MEALQVLDVLNVANYLARALLDEGLFAFMEFRITYWCKVGGLGLVRALGIKLCVFKSTPSRPVLLLRVFLPRNIESVRAVEALGVVAITVTDIERKQLLYCILKIFNNSFIITCPAKI